MNRILTAFANTAFMVPKPFSTPVLSRLPIIVIHTSWQGPIYWCTKRRKMLVDDDIFRFAMPGSTLQIAEGKKTGGSVGYIDSHEFSNPNIPQAHFRRHSRYKKLVVFQISIQEITIICPSLKIHCFHQEDQHT